MRRSAKRRLLASAVVLVASATLAACSSSTSSAPSGSSGSSDSGGLKTGLKAYVIPKLLGAQYFTIADSAKSGGAIAGLQTLGETGTETSGTAATPASELPADRKSVV